MQGLENEIARRYELKIRNMVPYKDGCIINIPGRKLLLKKNLLAPGRILFVHGAKEHLYKNHFECIDRYRRTLDGEPYFTYDRSNYTLSDMPAGRECNFDNRNDVIAAAKTLALLHKASAGYIPDRGSFIQDDLGKLPEYFGKRLSEIRRLKRTAKKGRHKFDYLYLRYADYFYELGDSVIKELTTSCYRSMVEEARRKGSFCHHDYTHSNIIIGEGGASVIHFDFCCFELKVYDIVNLIRRKMRKCDWNIHEAALILEHYCAIEPLDTDDFTLLKLMLKFPQKFWRVANRFYNSKRSWSERGYILKLQEAIDEVGSHRTFLEQFDRLI